MKASTDKARGKARHRARILIATGAATALTALGLSLPATALGIGGPPIISASEVTSAGLTEASLQASLDPNSQKTTFFFQYITQSDYEADGEDFLAGTLQTPTEAIEANLTEPHLVSATLKGLVPGVLYRARLFAHNVKGDVPGETLLFGTYPQAPAGLPESRAYEQASPVDKNGGDAIGIIPFVKASIDGDGITFGSTAGIPGGVGAQELPTYLASREGEGSAAQWVNRGLLPPQELGDGAIVLGWTPDFSRVFQQARIIATTKAAALYERSASGQETPLSGYVQGASYAYAGSSTDNATDIFESSASQLDTDKAGVQGRSNVYAWDGSHFHLASVLPNGSSPAKGAFAGPYDWAGSRNNEGGAASQYYTQEERAVSEDGSVFFTTAIEGHIYQRRNPSAAEEGCGSPAKACTLDVSPSRRATPDPAGTRPRAFMGASADGDTAFFTSPEELTDDAHTGPPVEGPKIGRVTIGPGPAEDAEEPLPEVLTGHHALGIAIQGEYMYWADPLQGTIARAKLDGSEADDEYITPGETCAETHPKTEPTVIHCEPSAPRYVSTGPCSDADVRQCIYWTNTGPLGGDLNRVKREVPVGGAGTIGRAKLGATKGEEVEPEFISGASNPQGIAVGPCAGGGQCIYWANSLNIEGAPFVGAIARAALDGSGVAQHFHETPDTPYGVALSATRIYWAMENDAGFGSVGSTPLEGGSAESIGVGSAAGYKPRGIAVIGPHVYWAAQGAGAIGRMRLPLEEPGDPNGGCDTVPRCESEFLPVGGAPGGLATETSHLYWSANGEIPPHPGNDLYRFQAEGTGGCATPGGCLTDLTADSAATNGAEVKGVMGISEDGTRVYFVANAALPGTGAVQAGDCQGFGGFGHGHCNLYMWEAGGGPAGSTSFIARLNANGDKTAASDLADWLPTISIAVMGKEKNSRMSADGQTLLFRSQEDLSAYQGQGTPQYYLYRVGRGITCVTCDPRGLAPQGRPSLGSIVPTLLSASFHFATASRNLSANGRRVFFETPQPLSPNDTNGEVSCDPVGSIMQEFPACLDVYEWEAPGEGACEEGGPAYSPLDEGCLYLISSGKSDWASLFGDASASGKDVFFFTRQGLVGQDQDDLLDVYDARVGGGIAAQNPPLPPPPCESPEGCRPTTYPPEGGESPASANFVGPPNPTPKHVKKAKKHHQKKHHHKHRKAHRAHAKRGAGQ
jgi:hypothetical protein